METNASKFLISTTSIKNPQKQKPKLSYKYAVQSHASSSSSSLHYSNHATITVFVSMWPWFFDWVCACWATAMKYNVDSSSHFPLERRHTPPWSERWSSTGLVICDASCVHGVQSMIHSHGRNGHMPTVPWSGLLWFCEFAASPEWHHHVTWQSCCQDAVDYFEDTHVHKYTNGTDHHTPHHWCKLLLLLLYSFNGLFSRTTWVSWHQKSTTILVKLIWIYWSKRQGVAVASARPYANLHLTSDR